MPTNLTGSFVDETFSQLLHVDGGPTALEKTIYSGTGTPTALKLGTISVSVENINFNGNTIATNDPNGDLFLSPNGSGSVTIANVNVLGGTIAGITDLTIADGGTGASDAAGARTNLGLGTMAVQNAASVAITGGTITNVTFSGSITGATLVSGTTLTGTTVNGGNLSLSGNTLISTNTDGNITFQPNGTGKIIIGLMQLSANEIVGTFTDGDINITPNGLGSLVTTTIKATTFDTNVVAAGVTLAGTTLAADGTDTDIGITLTPKGAGTVISNGPVVAPDVAVSDSLGYATGAGDSITQITSKSTGVTINAPCGQIVTHDESLSANTAATFTVTNSFVAATDVVICHRASGGTAGQYDIRVDAVAAGSFNVTILNGSGGALGEALTLNFAIIKAVNA
jgi:hypothetical protein